MAVSIASLPERLPDTGAIDTAGSTIGNAGAMASSHASDGVSSWSGLSAHYDSPDAATALNAVNMVQVFADEASTCAVAIELALRDFADAVEELRAEYDTVKELAAAHNAVDTSVTDFDLAAHHTAAGSLQERIDTVASSYDTASSTCADAIRAANTGKLFEVDSGGDPVWLLTYLTKRSVEGYTTKGKTTFFTYDFSNPQIVKPSALDRLPIPPGLTHRIDDWVEAGNRAIDDNYRRLLPDVTKNQFVSRTGAFDPFANPHFTALMASPSFRRFLGSDGKVKNPTLRRLMERHHLSVKDGTIKVGYAATDGTTRGGTKVPDWAGAGGTALKHINRGSNALGFASKSSARYDELRTEHPDWSQEQLLAEAAADGALEQAGEMVGEEIGAKVGTHVGRTAGAAVGQALIPIPGVGAAVGAVAGGFLGNMAGGFIGGKIGGAVGGWIGDNFDVTEVAKDVGKGIGEAADKVGDFIGGLFG
ncbi:MAG TPA: hypothetical protein VIG75_05130 [Citricoccus sp.]